MRTLTEKDYITNKILKPSDESLWAVFYIDRGKYFLSRLYKSDKRWCETKLKYSHTETLKFDYDTAVEIAIINKSDKKTIGVVNNRGVQVMV